MVKRPRVVQPRSSLSSQTPVFNTRVTFRHTTTQSIVSSYPSDFNPRYWDVLVDHNVVQHEQLVNTLLSLQGPPPTDTQLIKALNAIYALSRQRFDTEAEHFMSQFADHDLTSPSFNWSAHPDVLAALQYADRMGNLYQNVTMAISNSRYGATFREERGEAMNKVAEWTRRTTPPPPSCSPSLSTAARPRVVQSTHTSTTASTREDTPRPSSVSAQAFMTPKNKKKRTVTTKAEQQKDEAANEQVSGSSVDTPTKKRGRPRKAEETSEEMEAAAESSSPVKTRSSRRRNQSQSPAKMAPKPWESLHEPTVKARQALAASEEYDLANPVRGLTEKQKKLVMMCPLSYKMDDVIDLSKHQCVQVNLGTSSKPFVVTSMVCENDGIPLCLHKEGHACRLAQQNRPESENEETREKCGCCGCIRNHAIGPKSARYKEVYKSRPVVETLSDSEHHLETDVTASNEGEEEQTTESFSTQTTTQPSPELFADEEEQKAADSAAESQSTGTALPRFSMLKMGTQRAVIHAPHDNLRVSVCRKRTRSADDEQPTEEAEWEVTTDHFGQEDEVNDNDDDEVEVGSMHGHAASTRRMRVTDANKRLIPCTLCVEDMVALQLTTCTACHCDIGSHPRKREAELASIGEVDSLKAFKVPALSEFPVFQDPKDTHMSDPELFLLEFEDVCRLHKAPKELWCDLLRRSIKDPVIKKWLSDHGRNKTEWTKMREEFVRTHTDPKREEKLRKELHNYKQSATQSAFDYITEFRRLAKRLKRSETDTHLIEACLQGLNSALYAEMGRARDTDVRTNKALRLQDASIPVLSPNFGSLEEIQTALLEADRILRTHREHGKSGADSRSKSRRQWNGRNKFRRASALPSSRRTSSESSKSTDGNSAAGTTPAVPFTASAAPFNPGKVPPKSCRLEVKDGKPVNVNKKKKKVTFAKEVQIIGEGKPCFICKKTNHLQADCKFNKKGCKICSEEGHLMKDCPQWKPAAVRLCRTPAFPAEVVVAGQRHGLFMTSEVFSRPCLNVLVDSGAEFSSISSRLVKECNLQIHKPTNGINYFIGAAAGMKVMRQGYVNITVTAHFTLNGVREVVTFKKQFEVVDLPGEDFIVGMDLAPELFPGDAAMAFGARWASQMTSWPTNIQRHSWDPPRSAAVTTESKDSDSASEIALATLLSEVVEDELPSAAPPARLLTMSNPQHSE